MNITTGTRTRILAVLLLLVATTLGGMTEPRVAKNATGCSLEDESRPSPRGCLDGSGGCYDCLYSSGGGIIECWETPGGDIGGCQPFDPGRDPFEN
jgi:hypothetical protein